MAWLWKKLLNWSFTALGPRTWQHSINVLKTQGPSGPESTICGTVSCSVFFWRLSKFLDVFFKICQCKIHYISKFPVISKCGYAVLPCIENCWQHGQQKEASQANPAHWNLRFNHGLMLGKTRICICIRLLWNWHSCNLSTFSSAAKELDDWMCTCAKGRSPKFPSSKMFEQ